MGEAFGVCFISGSHPNAPCGVGDYTARLAEALAASGVAVSVVTSIDDRVRPGEGYRVVMEVPDWSLRQMPRLLRAVRRCGAAIVNLQYPSIGYRRGIAPAALLIALRLSRRRPKVVLTLHELRRFRWTQRWLLRLAASFADLVVVVDATQTGTRFSLPPVLRPRVAQIPVGANIRPPIGVHHQIDSTRRSSSETELVVGTWGFLAPDKGVDDVIAAFAKVASQRPARLVIAGDLGPEHEYIEQVRTDVVASGIADRTTFTGWLPEEELSEVLRSFDVCVLPFKRGVQPNRGSYVTSIAHGIYTVTTSTERLGYDPISGTTFVPPGDREALSRAILDIRSGSRARGGTLDWAEIAARYLAEYHSLVDREPKH